MRALLGIAIVTAFLIACTPQVVVHVHVPPCGRPGLGPGPGGHGPWRPPGPGRGGGPWWRPGAGPPGRVPNGGFESGGLEPGWSASGTEGGYAAVVRQGSRWSADTEAIELPSPPFAALVRSSGPAPVTSVGALTSAPFEIARRQLVLAQRSESSRVDLGLEILEAGSDQVLYSTPLAPSVGAFATHRIDVGSHCGALVRLRVKQHTTEAGRGWYSLLDDFRLEGPPCGPARK